MSRITHVTLLALLLGLALLFVSRPVCTLAQEANVPGAVTANQDARNAGGQTDSYLWWFIRSSGLIGLFILALSIYFVATVIRLFMEIRPEVAAPPELIQSCEERLQRNDFASIYATVREEHSFLGRVLSTGLSELPNGLAEARDAMDRMGDAETIHLEKQISMLAVLGTLGPMIGLIGTLKGMISSFSVIAMSDVQLKASEVAGGISEALLLTFEGVALSVPAIYFFAVFRNRVASISATTMLHANHLLRHVARSIQTSGPQQAASASSPAVPPPVRGQDDFPRKALVPDPGRTA